MGRRFREQMEQMQQQATPPVNNAEDKPKEEKKDEKPAEPKKDEGPRPLTRPPVNFDNSASLAEQKLDVDSKRQVSFNFQKRPGPSFWKSWRGSRDSISIGSNCPATP